MTAMKEISEQMNLITQLLKQSSSVIQYLETIPQPGSDATSRVFCDAEFYSIMASFKRSNHRVSSLQLSSINSLIAASHANILDYDHDLLNLQYELTSVLAKILFLRDQRSVFQDKIKHWVALKSSVRLLPSDVLVHIFKFALPSEITLYTRSSPIIFCSVCSLWREAALGCPSLWNTSQICATDRFKLEPGDNMTCSLVMKTPQDPVDFPTAKLIRLVSPCYQYLTKIIIRVDHMSTFTLFSLPTGTIPHIHILDIGIKSLDYEDQQPLRLFENGGVPDLRFLDLSFPKGTTLEQRTCVAAVKSSSPSPITHLLSTRTMLMSTFADTYLRCANLVAASFTVKGRDLIGGIESVTLPRLLYLYITIVGETTDNFIQFCSKCELPMLELLTLEATCGDPATLSIQLSKFETIRSLSLLAGDFSPILGLLPKSCPGLKQLYVSDIPPQLAFTTLSSLRECLLDADQGLSQLTSLTVATYNIHPTNIQQLLTWFQEFEHQCHHYFHGKTLRELVFILCYPEHRGIPLKGSDRSLEIFKGLEGQLGSTHVQFLQRDLLADEVGWIIPGF